MMSIYVILGHARANDSVAVRPSAYLNYYLYYLYNLLGGSRRYI